LNSTIVVDANLLLLFVVGSAERQLITKHKRLKEYTEHDYDILRYSLTTATLVVVTPNVLTETSNLACQIGEPAKSRILAVFRTIIHQLDEQPISSQQASNQPEFLRLGLTDAGLLESLSSSTTLLTADLDLYIAAHSRGYSAVNFRHLT
jgi:hypothetical protein